MGFGLLNFIDWEHNEAPVGLPSKHVKVNTNLIGIVLDRKGCLAVAVWPVG